MDRPGEMKSWRVPNLRDVNPAIRRGRLLAARAYRPGTVPRHAILGGYWDRGSIVRQHMGGVV
ncbi:hypothetical protein GRI97_08255 [Altererythrobacter xixiisoli]|uniref:Uncharacterized protein n=2 Tax=Croceibacterium xixiisoli TaxID=1476466 RepID=A0A6I4TUN2_9SPHN|nr:hypothetical protein [Croceibacterium xixiisoli]